MENLLGSWERNRYAALLGKHAFFLCLLHLFLLPHTVGAQNIGASARIGAEVQHIEVLDGSSLDFTDDFTIEAWILVDEFPPEDEEATIFDNVSLLGGGLKWVITNTGRLELSFPYLVGFTNTFTSDESIPGNQWVHVALTWDYNFPPADDIGKMYINGVLVGSVSFLNGISSSIASLYIGGLPGGIFSNPDAGLRGYMGELKIWDTTRSADEVAADRFAACNFPPSLKLYYDFYTEVQGISTDFDLVNIANPGNFNGRRFGVGPGFSSTLETLATASTLYVDANVGQSGVGVTWGTAFKTLDEALVAAHARCNRVSEIRVAAGTYQPTRRLFDGSEEVGTSDDRDKAFHIRRGGLHLRGGYANGGSATANATLNPTLLSGDFNGNDGVGGSGATLTLSGNTENAYHVLVSNGEDTQVTGFIIEGGNANGGGTLTVNGQDIPRNQGGGAYNITSLSQVVLRHNAAAGNGGALYNSRRLGGLQEVVFNKNHAGGDGGGLFFAMNSSDMATIAFDSITWAGNQSLASGGGAFLANIQAPLNITRSLFQDNTAQNGGGAYATNVQARITITRGVFQNNSAQNGGGVYAGNVQSTFDITEGIFQNNSAQKGGAIHCTGGTGDYLLNRCVFENNTSGTGDGGALASENSVLDLRNGVFVGNTAVRGGAMWLSGGQHSILNSTFQGSAANEGSTVHNTGNGNSIINSILWGNSGGQAVFNAGGSALAVSYSVVEGTPYPGEGNSNANPNFILPSSPRGPDGLWRTNDDGLRLDCQSSAFNTAQPAGLIDIDIRGTSRPQFDLPDAGAYESDRDLIPTTIVLSGETTATNYLEHIAAGGVAFQWSGGDTPNQAANIFRASGTYTVTVTNSFGCTNTASVDLTILPCPGSSTLYVDSSAVVSGNGLSWATAFKTLDEALVVSWRCDAVTRIEVARGTYIPGRSPFRPDGIYVALAADAGDQMFHLRNGVALVGGYPNLGGTRDVIANPTILKGNGSGRVLLAIAAHGASLDGFTIQQGVAPDAFSQLMVGSVAVSRYYGGGFLCIDSDLVVTNCTFKNNAAGFGGGLYSIGGSPLYRDCTFRHNTAGSSGGGTYVDANGASFVNCVWYGNVANNSGNSTQAGGIQVLGNPSLIHCTFWGNTGSDILGEPRLRNTLTSGGIYSLQEGGNSDVLFAYPMFVDPDNPAGPDGIDRTADDGLALRENSPAINAGVAADSVAEDVTGALRVGLPDVGAYEAYNACTFSTPKTIFVKQDANGTNDGSSWANAFPSLTVALEQACIGDQIWVATGVYMPEAYPPYCTDCSTPRDYAFALKNGVKVYGGFAGTESSLSQRNIEANIAALSGDIGVLGDDADNCHHVVLSLSDSKETLLDGFTIRDGHANGFSVRDTLVRDYALEAEFPDLFPDGAFQIIQIEVIRQVNVEGSTLSQIQGGGLYWNSSRALMRNCTVSGNKAYQAGGGWNIVGGAVSHANTFVGNTAATGGGINVELGYLELEQTKVLANTGGGVRSADGSFNNSFFMDNMGAGVDISIGYPSNTPVYFTNCVFYNNNAGGLRSNNNSPVLVNCTSAKNKLYFGSIRLTIGNVETESSAFVANSIIWSNEGESGLEKENLSFRLTVKNSIWQGAGEAMNMNGNANNVDEDPDYADFANPAGPDNKYGTADDGLAPNYIGPALNLGDTLLNSFSISYVRAPAQDVTGTLRTEMPDAGAYEAFVSCPTGRTPERRYVNHLATGDNDGTSWANAFTSLAVALNQSCGGDEVWVAAGTYLPAYDESGDSNPTDPRTKTFTMRVNGVQLYGGFRGGETLRTQRNWIANPTLLSGDLGTVGDSTDNAYHVVVIEARLDSITAATVLDGFTIRDGRAYGSSVYDNINTESDGGGMYIYGHGKVCNPTLANCTFTDNAARSQGGAMFNKSNAGGTSNPTLTNCSFFDNYAGNGGAMYNESFDGGTSSPTLINCALFNNSAYLGGGIYNKSNAGGTSNPVLTHCTIFGNSAQFVGGMYNNGFSINTCTPTLTNCIIWGNTASMEHNNTQNDRSAPSYSHCIVEGSGGSSNWDSFRFGTDNGNNLDANPNFVNPANPNGPDNTARTADDGLRLTDNSPARYAGNSSANVPFDILRNPRDAGTDIGAYEYREEPIAPPTAPTGTLVIINSTCTNCTVGGGSIALGTVSGTGGTLEYSTDGGNTWGSTLPTYNQTGPAQTILASILAMDGNRSEAVLVGTTAPGTCDAVNALIAGTTSGCESVTLVASGGQTYQWNGGNTPNQAENTFVVSGMYTVMVTGANGCQETASANVTIAPSTGSTTTETACGSYTWTVNGQTYTTSGTYLATSTCSSDTLVLTIAPSTSSTTSETACLSYTWSVNGQTYTASGTYFATSACSSDTLVLNIKPITSSTTTETACGSYTWAVNGQTYTLSDTYIESTPCRNDTLVLTITPLETSTTAVSVCDTYTWPLNNQTYTTAGVYVETGACRVDTLQLTFDPNLCIQIQGNMIWEHDLDTPLEGVNIALTGDDTGSTTTNGAGNYNIQTTGGNLTLTPTKNTSPRQGVDAADAVRIRQHALGTLLFNDGYKVIAADVNESNSVTSVDAVIIQQALMGNAGAGNLLDNPAWRFVDAAHTFANENAPWGFPANVALTGVVASVPNVDFVGVKMGDVNGTWSSGLSFIAQPAVWLVADQNLEAGKIHRMAFALSENLPDVAAWQFALRLDPAFATVSRITPKAVLPLTRDDFGTTNLLEGELRTVFAQAQGQPIEAGEVVFELELTIRQGGVLLSDVLTLDNDILDGRVYDTALKGGAVKLAFAPVRDKPGLPIAPTYAEAAFELYQNVPNPFVAETMIAFSLPTDAAAVIAIHDASGRVVAQLSGDYAAGYNTVHLTRDALKGATGVLTYTVTAGEYTATRRMVITP